ncbi:MAG: glycosyltransferase [Lachnospiraceae bacterium]|nr:glycosyltransferase [Lachnospiraceae bacterium]
MNEHTFAVCAYQDSHYLEDCIRSLEDQTVKSEIYIATSTPDEYISDIAERHGIPVYVNEGEHGITQDWNFALSIAKSSIVTIAHQDDVYLPDYTRRCLDYAARAEKPLIYFSDYAELRNGSVVKENRNLKIKRFLLKGLRNEKNWSRIPVRRRSLSLGDAICAPAVTFFLDNLTQPVFNDHFEASEDWEAWEKLSKLDGDFVYNPEIQMYHRIHAESTTTKVLGKNHRTSETYEMYQKFWPSWIAHILTKAYSGSEKSNQI